MIPVLLLATALAAQPDPQAFRARCGELAKAAAKTHYVVEGANGELFLEEHLRALGAGRFWGEDAPKASKGRKADPLIAIVDFKKQLQARGVELLVVPIPPKALMHPEWLPGASPVEGKLPRLDTVEQEFFAALREQGVEVLDLLPALLERRGGPTLYCKTDHHLNGRGQVLLAQLIAEAVKDRPWLAAAQADAPAWSAEWKATPIEGGLSWMRAAAVKIVREPVDLRYVRHPKTRQFPAETRNAPVLLMGDSNALVFHAGAGDTPASSMHAVGAGLLEQLTAELKTPVDLAGTLIDGVDATRITLRNRERAKKGYLAGKRLVVWVFFESSLSQLRDGWRVLPLP